MLLPTSHWAQFPFSFIVRALYCIFSTQNKWYNYKSLLSLIQANYSVIMVRISYAPSRCVSPPFPLKSHASCSEKSLLIKGWVRLSPRTRSVDVDRIDHKCQTQSESKATLESSDSPDWTYIKESRHKDMSNSGASFWSTLLIYAQKSTRCFYRPWHSSCRCVIRRLENCWIQQIDGAKLKRGKKKRKRKTAGIQCIRGTWEWCTPFSPNSDCASSMKLLVILIWRLEWITTNQIG